MTTTNVAQVPAKLYELLAPLTPEERLRVVQATLILFGDDKVGAASPLPPLIQSPSNFATSDPGGSSSDAVAFFEEKAPRNKGELLAVAARFRELVEKEESHSKADLKKVITDARRNFDSNNYARDIGNAKRQAGFFNLGTGRDATTLSYFGQQFVDALPDRDAAGKLKRPKVGGSKKRTAKKKRQSKTAK
ncbi:MAG: hypothetical protein ABSB96_01545 [Gaiellaceae bacterium]